MNKKAVLALGGNAIIQAGQKGTISEQFKNTRESLNGIVELVKQGYQLAITHGNGPQVGNMLIQQMAGIDKGGCSSALGVLNAATEGTMGYMIEQSLQNAFHANQIEREVVTIATQVVVDKDDPSIKSPSKPVGPFYSKEQAENMQRNMDGHSRRCRQRLSSSSPLPIPKEIIPFKNNQSLVESGKIVIACGGGGIPVYRTLDGSLEGIDAVIDKDFASGLLAKDIDADYLVILTGVDRVAINYGKANQTDLESMTVEEAKQYMADGQFPKGSMGPKIAAAIRFLEDGGNTVLITSIERIVDAFAGKTGTLVVR